MAKLYQSPCYCTNLRRSANALGGFYDQILQPCGLTASQYYLLINLQRMGGANITHWAQWVGLERSTMVRNIRPLEQRGLVVLGKGRGKTYVLSSSGEEALQLAVPLWQRAQQEIEQYLGAEDAQAVLRIGARLQDWQ